MKSIPRTWSTGREKGKEVAMRTKAVQSEQCRKMYWVQCRSLELLKLEWFFVKELRLLTHNTERGTTGNPAVA
ncbi:hypothetical protein MUK42_34095 [Musa troglodytarum]|uniref:Uncharacterized protein n=1 Tax=Musa troglodytarum TaxID=320322 RepID=A0A9E7FZK2_9LILI|nr:hypothetical protein MUK42_34095 [Musa troglodytarum]